MTHAEIDALPAGRELNALVAEKVFDSKEPDTVIPLHAPDSWWMAYHSGSLVSGDGIWRIRPSNQTNAGWDPKPYSTDIAAVWEVVEKLHQDYHDIQLENDCEEHTEDVWFVQIMPIRAKAPTAPLAICRAALKAVASAAKEAS